MFAKFKDSISLERIAIGLFVVGSVFLEGSASLRSVGLFLIAVSFGSFFHGKYFRRWSLLHHPPELIAFTLWTIWALVTMLYISEYPELVRIRWQVQLQVIVIIWALYGLFRIHRSLRFVFGCIALAAAIQGGLSLTGHVEVLSEEFVTNMDLIGVRMSGTGRATNSNVLGLLMTRGTLVCLLLWRLPDRDGGIVRKIILCMLIFMFGYVVMISGSRKASIFFGITLLGWLGWARPIKTGLLGCGSKIVFLVVGLCILNVSVPWLSENTSVGKRWMELINRGDGTIGGTLEGDVRLHLSELGLELWRERPIAGIGLGHFMMYNSKRMMSHNDYIETLSGTGLIGFIIYQSMKVILGFRLWILLFGIKDPFQRYQLKVMVLMWLFIVLSGAGFHQYHDYQTIIMFTMLFTYTWIWKNNPQQIDEPNLNPRGLRNPALQAQTNLYASR